VLCPFSTKMKDCFCWLSRNDGLIKQVTPMKRYLLYTTVALLLFSSSALAQRWKLARLEVTGGLTTLNYFGDIGGASSSSNLMGLGDMSLSSTRPGVNLGLSYRFADRLYFNGSYNFGFLAQSDIGSRNESRDYAFSTMVNEITVQAAYYIIRESDEPYFYSALQTQKGFIQYKQPLSVYVFAGVGGLSYKVTAKNSFEESLRFDDSKTFSVVVPIGVGVKYALFPRISFGAELGGRYAFSDLLDGFQPSASKSNDVYYMANFKFFYKIQSRYLSKGYTPK